MLCNEQIVTFTEAAARLPRFNGRKVHSSSIWRWARKGVRGVRLECRRLGGRFVTSVEALDRFGKALAEAETGTGHPVAPSVTSTPTRTDSEREKAVTLAEAALAEAGI